MRLFNLLPFILPALSTTTVPPPSSICHPETFPTKPNIFVLSDISNEPDDTQSLIRFLLYANQFTIHGITATTSYWLNSSTHPEAMFAVVDAYEKVVDNLNAHAGGYPSADFLRGKISSGPSVYGMAAVIPGGRNISDGASRLVSAADSVTDGTFWVLCWGGANTLAQALEYVRATRTASETADFVAKLRVYSISDQDDAGAWIRQEFSTLRYICSIHGWNHYRLAAWTGISGEGYNGFDFGGPDSELVSAEWLRDHIQLGDLGGAYPDVLYIMEGDTPSFLGLIENGLNVPENPEWGGWGGRYSRVDLAGRYGHFSDAVDWAIGKDGRKYGSNHASIWRWREDFQSDFAARIQWSLSPDYSSANHPPVVQVNGTCGNANPLEINVSPGTTVVLDASRSWDPDGGVLRFFWWHYKEPTATQTNVDAEVVTLNFSRIDEEGSVVGVKVPEWGVACVDLWGRVRDVCQAFHVVLEVVDVEGLKRYMRVVLKVRNVPPPSGRGGIGEENVVPSRDEL
ncbi:hypothetical protein RUND412_004889 [Rhizina undulata]